MNDLFFNLTSNDKYLLLRKYLINLKLIRLNNGEIINYITKEKYSLDKLTLYFLHKFKKEEGSPSDKEIYISLEDNKSYKLNQDLCFYIKKILEDITLEYNKNLKIFNNLSLNNDLIFFKNGYLNINTNEFVKNNFYYLYNIEYDYNLDSIDYDNYLIKIFKNYDNQLELITLTYYCLVNNNRHNYLFYCYGYPGTGKSIFFNILKKIIGSDLSYISELNRLKLSRFETYNLKDKKLYIYNENEQNIDEDNLTTLKNISGENILQVEPKGKISEKIQLLGKLIFISNRLPNLKYTDEAILRRFKFIEFKKKFNDTNINIEEYLDDKSIQNFINYILKFVKENNIEYIKKSNKEIIYENSKIVDTLYTFLEDTKEYLFIEDNILYDKKLFNKEIINIEYFYNIYVSYCLLNNYNNKGDEYIEEYLKNRVNSFKKQRYSYTDTEKNKTFTRYRKVLTICYSKDIKNINFFSTIKHNIVGLETNSKDKVLEEYIVKHRNDKLSFKDLLITLANDYFMYSGY